VRAGTIPLETEESAMISSGDEPLTASDDANRNADEALRAAKSDGGANLDKVRDILFGSQLRDVERRFARLEERLVKETNDLREDVKKRLDAIESYARSESESLAGQVKSEREDRVESDSGLSRELKDTARALERRLSSADELFAKTNRELRQQMLDQHQRLSDDLRQKIDEVLKALARESSELRSDKADRATLAALLTEMAMRLTNELRVPGAEDIGNA
jgi:hypothetical protein